MLNSSKKVVLFFVAVAVVIALAFTVFAATKDYISVDVFNLSSNGIAT